MPSGGRWRCRSSGPPPGGPAGRRPVCAPPPGWKRVYWPLPSKFCDSPESPTERLEELLVVLACRWSARRPGSPRRRSGRIDLERAAVDRSTCGSSSTVASVNSARSPTAGCRSPTRPCSSAGETSARVWRIHGNAASIVAGVSRTPGMISRANARVGGNAAFSVVERRAGRLEHPRQQRDRLAQVVLLGRERRRGGVEVGDQVLELLLAAGRAPRRPSAGRAISFERSCGSVPSSASLTIAVPRSASAEYRASRSATRRRSRPSWPGPGRRPRRPAARR